MALIESNFLPLSITISKNLTAWNKLIPQRKKIPNYLKYFFRYMWVFRLFLKKKGVRYVACSLVVSSMLRILETAVHLQPNLNKRRLKGY